MGENQKFEISMKKLESIVEKLESGSPDLDKMLKLFAYVRACCINLALLRDLLPSVNNIAPASDNSPISVSFFPSTFFVIEAAGNIFTPPVSLALLVINSIYLEYNQIFSKIMLGLGKIFQMILYKS